MRARTCTRVREKGMVLTEMKGFSGTYSAFKKNASAFDLKRKGVSVQTLVRLGWNARAFFHEQKQKEILHGKGHKKRSSAELQPLLTLNLIL